MMQTPVSLTISIKPLRCGSAPTAPAPPRNTRCILPQDQQEKCIEDFHASWPVLPANSKRGGREVNFPRLSLNVQHRRSSTNDGAPTTPSPLAMLAFQRAFQKMKQQAAVKPTNNKIKTTATTSKPLPSNLPTMNSKPINASTAAALERLNAMAPSSSTSSPASSNNDKTSPRKLARRRQQQHQLLFQPQKPTANNFNKTSSSGKLNLLLGRPSALTNSPSAGRLINHNQMRRVRSSGSRGNLNQMLY